jgi:hypothetical protein
LATNEEKDFAKEILDYKSVNMNLFKKFIDIALPAMSKSCFINNMSCYCLSSEVTAAEETFAILAFENSVRRWVFMIEKEIYEDNIVDDDNEDRMRFERRKLPDLKYQKNIKARADGRATAGVWTEKAKERFNEICSMVQDKRGERIEFEQLLKEMYVENATDSLNSTRIKRKRMDENSEDGNGNKTKVKVVNLFELIEL